MKTSSKLRQAPPFSFTYPFTAAALEPEDRELVRAVLADAESKYQLCATRPELIELCAVFLTHCSPANPDRDALEVVTRILHILMYFADRVAPSAVEQEAHDAWELILGRGSETQGARLSGVRGAAADAGSRFAAALARRGADASSFAHLLRTNLSAFVWAAQNPTFGPASLDEHLEFRRESICAVTYLRLWGLLSGLTPSEETALGFVLGELEVASATVQALANDIRSIDRDRRCGVPNAVLVVEEHHRLDRADAVRTVRTRHDKILENLVRKISHVRTLPGSSRPAVSSYLDFIGTCTRGNETSMLDLAGRYS